MSRHVSAYSPRLLGAALSPLVMEAEADVGAIFSTSSKALGDLLFLRLASTSGAPPCVVKLMSSLPNMPTNKYMTAMEIMIPILRHL